MTPIDLARNLAQSADPTTQARGIAIVIRSLTDDTDERQGWPMDLATAAAAAKHLGLDPRTARLHGLLDEALELAPTLSDAILNKAARS